MSKKHRRNLEVISRIDSEIIEKASSERAKLLLAFKKRMKRIWLMRAGAMAASFFLIAATVLVLVTVLSKEVPVYTGMTVSNTAPTVAASIDLPTYLAPNGNADKNLQGNYVGGNPPIGEKPFDKTLDAALEGAFEVEGTTTTYYAKPNEDIYITIHINNPDQFEILSFTLNDKKYQSHMFEYGSDLENIILKVNVGDVEGMVSYTIDAIKYVDGTKIKDVKIGGNRTVEIGVYTEKQPAALFSASSVGYNSISFAVDVSDTLNLLKTLSGDVEAVLFDGNSIVARKPLSATEKTAVTFDGLKTGTLYQYAVIATYDMLDGNGLTQRVLASHAVYTKNIVLFDHITVGTVSAGFDLMWDTAFANKSLTALSLYQNGSKVQSLAATATTVAELVPGTTYTLTATYQNGGAAEEISITFTTKPLVATINQYLENLDGSYTLLKTEDVIVPQGTAYVPPLDSYQGFTTPTVPPFTMTDSDHVFDCYFARTHYAVTFVANNGTQVTEQIKFGLPIVCTDTPVRDGFVFGGWYLDAALTKPASDPVPAEPITVYAKWLVETAPADLTYTVTNNQVTVTGFADITLTDLVLPAYIAGQPVTAIGNNAFRNATTLRTVVLPNTLTEIGTLAFWRTGITALTIPASVVTIGEQAFANCATLDTVTLAARSNPLSLAQKAFASSSIRTVCVEKTENWFDLSFSDNTANPMHAGAALYCDGQPVTELTVPAGVTTLGKHLFYGNSSLTAVTLPAGVTSLEEGAFESCTALERVSFAAGSTVTVIPDSTFLSCAKLTDVALPQGLDAIAPNAFAACTALPVITLPGSLTQIGAAAFSGCTALHTVVIPESVTTIGENAYLGCTGVTSASMPVAALTAVSFSNCEALTLTSSGTLTEHALLAYQKLQALILGCGIDAVEPGALQHCTALTSLTVQADHPTYISVDNCLIDSSAKALVAGIQTSVIPTDGTVTTIGKWAFYGQSAMTELIVPNAVTAIAAEAFYEMPGLIKVSIPFMGTSPSDKGDGTNSGDDNAFEHVFNCEYSIRHLVITGPYAIPAYASSGLRITTLEILQAPKIGWSAFVWAKSLTTVYLPATLTEISGGAFNSCDKIEHVVIEDIAAWCAVECSRAVGGTPFLGLTEKHLYLGDLEHEIIDLVIPEGVTQLGTYCFYGLDFVESIKLPSTLTEYGLYSLDRISALKYIIISDITTWCEHPYTGDRLSDRLYLGDKEHEIIDLVIPAGTRMIAAHAFASLASVKTVSIPAELQSIGAQAFIGCSGLTTLTFAQNSQLTKIGEGAFAHCTNLTELKLPASLETVEEGAFSGCSSLKTLCFEENSQLQNIGNNAFESCVALTEIKLPTDAQVGVEAFRNCTALRTATIRLYDLCEDFANLTSLTVSGEGTLYATWLEYCPKLQSFTIGAGFTYVEPEAIRQCSALTTLLVEAGNPTYIAVNNCLIDRGTKTMVAGIKTSVIPDDGSVTTIGKWAFYGQSAITELVVPDAVTVIEAEAFYGMTSLKKLTVPFVGTSPADVGTSDASALSHVVEDRLEHIVVTGAYEIPKYAMDDFKSLKTIELLKTPAIGAEAFYWCESLQTLYLPATLKTIGDGAFYYCTKLEHLIIEDVAAWCGVVAKGRANPNLVATEVSTHLYLGDLEHEIIDLVIPEGVTAIERARFYGLTYIQSVKLPSTLQTVKSQVFFGCSALRHVILSDIAAWCQITYEHDDYSYIFGKGYATPTYTMHLYLNDRDHEITDLVIPEGVTFIESGTFANFNNIDTVVIPSSVTGIGAWSFGNCTKLTTVYYSGTAEEWATLKNSIPTSNDVTLKQAICYYYSATKPAADHGSYWRWVGDVPTVWEEND